MRDIDLLVSNCKEYCQVSGVNNRLVSKVYQLQDTVLSMVAQIDRLFIKKCESIAAKKLELMKSSSYEPTVSGVVPTNSNIIDPVEHISDTFGNDDEKVDTENINDTAGSELVLALNPSIDEKLELADVESNKIVSGPPSLDLSMTIEDDHDEFNCYIDLDRLKSIMSNIVNASEGKTIDELEKMLFQFYRHLHSNFNVADKSKVLDEFQSEIDKM